MSVIIRVSDLTKEFGDEMKAVDGLSFSVSKGEVYGFLGQNGAGKSTTIRMLLTLITPTSGEIELFGLSLAKYRKQVLKKVGAIIERPDLYKYLTARENLRIFAAMSGIKPTDKKITDQLELVGLADRADSKVKTYSQGMKQRLGIATALIHDPDLVILDEPTNGLDPQGIADVRRLILHLSHDLGKTVMVSSHLLTEMEMIADSMLIIDKGRKVVEGKRDELLNPDTVQVEIVTDDKERTISVLRTSEWASALQESLNGVVMLDIAKVSIPELNRWLVAQQVNVFSIRAKHSLEDFFLSVTKH